MAISFQNSRQRRQLPTGESLECRAIAERGLVGTLQAESKIRRSVW